MQKARSIAHRRRHLPQEELPSQIIRVHQAQPDTASSLITAPRQAPLWLPSIGQFQLSQLRTMVSARCSIIPRSTPSSAAGTMPKSALPATAAAKRDGVAITPRTPWSTSPCRSPEVTRQRRIPVHPDRLPQGSNLFQRDHFCPPQPISDARRQPPLANSQV